MLAYRLAAVCFAPPLMQQKRDALLLMLIGRTASLVRARGQWIWLATHASGHELRLV